MPVWSPARTRERVPASISSNFAIVISGAASLLLGIYPTALLIAGQLGANPIGNWH